MTITTAPGEGAASTETWTIQRILAWSTDFLRSKGFESPRLDAELLLSHALGCKRIQLYTSFDKPLSPSEREPFKGYLKRRSSGEPVAYITGVREFMGLPFKVSPSVLIPRPDTEVLVEAVQKDVCERHGRTGAGLRILDVGTGSGCIALSLARVLPEAALVAWDVEAAAINQAELNAAELGVTSVRFEVRDALVPRSWQIGPVDYLLSNPPYISHQEEPDLPVSVRAFEPHRALFAEDDGLAFYKVFASKGLDVLTSGGRVFVEVGHLQGPAVVDIFKRQGWQRVSILKDYEKRDRVVTACSGD